MQASPPSPIVWSGARVPVRHASPTRAFSLRGSITRTDLTNGATLLSYNVTVENNSGLPVATFCPRLDLRSYENAATTYAVVSVHASLGNPNARFDGVRRRVLLQRPVTLPSGAAIVRVCLRTSAHLVDRMLADHAALFSFTGDFDQAGGNNGSLCVRLYRSLDMGIAANENEEEEDDEEDEDEE